MTTLFAAALISTLQLQGDAAVAGGDYLLLDFDVPPGTVELTISRDYDKSGGILDFGVWSSDGFRGWGGGLTEPLTVGNVESSRGYLPGAVAPGRWRLVVGKARIDRDPIHFTADVSFYDAATLPPERRVPHTARVLERKARWYRGDFHAHSSGSGDATLDLGKACIGCAWKHADTPWNDVAALEIQTGQYTQAVHFFLHPALAFWDEKLDAGARVAPVGGSDDHRAGKTPRPRRASSAAPPRSCGPTSCRRMRS